MKHIILLSLIAILSACISGPKILDNVSDGFSEQQLSEFNGKTIAVYNRLLVSDESQFTHQQMNPAQAFNKKLDNPTPVFSAKVAERFATHAHAKLGQTFVMSSLLGEINALEKTRADFILIVRVNFFGDASFHDESQKWPVSGVLNLGSAFVADVEVRRGSDWTREAFASCEVRVPDPEKNQSLQIRYSEAAWLAYQNDQFKTDYAAAMQQCAEQILAKLGV